MTSTKLLFAFAVLASPVAAANPDPQATLGADVLFREGKQLMKDGKLAEACEKFDASNRLDESSGTLLNLGDCREKTGQLAKSWAAFMEAATLARTKHDTSRENVARTRARALEPRLSYVTIAVPAPARIAGLVIKRDGTAIDPALWNVAVPVDAGAETVTAEAPGHQAWSTKVDVVGEHQKLAVEVPHLADLAGATPDPKRAILPPPSPRVVDTPARAPLHPVVDNEGSARGTFTTLRKVSLITATVGLVGVAGGVVFGLKANDLESQSNAICPTTTCPDPHALDLNHQAKTDATRSNVLFVAGGAAVATAVVLWLVGAPDHAGHGVALVPVVDGRAGLTLTGTF